MKFPTTSAARRLAGVIVTSAVGISVAASAGIAVPAQAAGTGTVRSAKAAPKKAAAKKPAPASTAKYCTAAKAWLAFENATLESGPYDDAWVATTQKLMVAMVKVAPKSIRSATATFAIDLIYSRRSIAGTGAITNEDEIYFLREAAADQNSNVAVGARDAVGAYALKNCKIDVLKPFRDLAAGFE